MASKNLVVSPVLSETPTHLVEEFLTPKQLAARLPVKVSTIWDWTRRRNRNPIPHYPISRKVVLYKWSEVVKWVESQRRRAV